VAKQIFIERKKASVQQENPDADKKEITEVVALQQRLRNRDIFVRSY